MESRYRLYNRIKNLDENDTEQLRQKFSIVLRYFVSELLVFVILVLIYAAVFWPYNPEHLVITFWIAAFFIILVGAQVFLHLFNLIRMLFKLLGREQVNI
jgi:polyferredoxin